MSLGNLRRALAITALAVAMGTCATSLASASTSGESAAPEEAVVCELGAQVILNSTTTGVQGIGAVRCSEPVFHIDVTVVLSRDTVPVARAGNTCARQAGCRAAATAADIRGIQVWCAESRGHYALSPTGPIIDLGAKRACARG